jgi:hypothetical protein
VGNALDEDLDDVEAVQTRVQQEHDDRLCTVQGGDG